MLLLLGSNVAIADKSHSLTLSFEGVLVDVGIQHYHLSGGSLVSASVAAPGTTLSLTSTHLEYSVDAKVRGNTVTGHADLQLGGKDSKSGVVSLEGRVNLNDMIPAIGFPLSPSDPSNPLACLASSCTSKIPGFFMGLADLQLKVGDKRISLPSTPMLFESAYLNPFGGPIFIGTSDGSISIAAKYTSALSEWANARTTGFVTSGSAGQGSFSLVSSLTENLLKGTESDQGQITLFGFTSTPVLNSAGEFEGKSVIPAAIAGSDCTLMVNAQLNSIPGFSVALPPKTCTETGSISTGGFELKSAQGEAEIKGRYIDIWSVPAIGFTGQASATIRGE